MFKSSSFWFLVLIHLGLSLWMVAPFRGGIIAAGESSIYLNPYHTNYYSQWNEKVNFGRPSIIQNNIVLFSWFWEIFEWLGFIAHPSVIFIFLTYFLSGIFFAISLHQVFKFKNWLYYLPASLFYAFNVFRLLGPINERQSLLFIFLPLFFIGYHLLITTRQWRYLWVLTLLSFLSSSMGGNLPVFTIPYLLIFIWLIFYCLTHWKERHIFKLAIQTSIFFFLAILVNGFWLYSMITGLFYTFHHAPQELSFQSLASGTFTDHLRLMGAWSWKGGHMNVPYYRFATNYDRPLLVFTTYLISLLAIFGAFFIKRVITKDQKSTLKFIAFLLPLSLLLMAGNKEPTRIIFEFLYQNLLPFKMYREPYAKFTPLLILSYGWLLTLTIYYLTYKLRPKWKSVMILLTCFLVLINAYPFFTVAAIPTHKWIGGKGGYLINIPEHWNQVKTEIETNLLDSKLVTSPFNNYGGSHLWPAGAGMVGNAADYLIDRPIIRGWTIDRSPAGFLMKNIFTSSETINLSKILGQLNAWSILQLNEIDWRYGGGNIPAPSQSNQFLQSSQLQLIASQGRLTTDVLNQVDEDPDPAKRQQAIEELANQPAINIYQVKESDFVPHFYVPEIISTTNLAPSDLPKLITDSHWLTPSAVYFAADPLPKGLSYPTDTDLNSYPTIQRPQIEFKKISPVKYRLQIHRARDQFPLVFSETFHEGWQVYLGDLTSKLNADSQLLTDYQVFAGNEQFQANIQELTDYFNQGWVSTLGDGRAKQRTHYQFRRQLLQPSSTDTYTVAFVSKNFHGTIQNNNLSSGRFYETWWQSPVSQQQHFLVNGYANSWLINPSEFCQSPAKCLKNPDGSFDFELIVEFEPQRKFITAWVIALVTVAISLAGYLISRRQSGFKYETD